MIEFVRNIFDYFKQLLSACFSILCSYDDPDDIIIQPIDAHLPSVSLPKMQPEYFNGLRFFDNPSPNPSQLLDLINRKYRNLSIDEQAIGQDSISNPSSPLAQVDMDKVHAIDTPEIGSIRSYPDLNALLS